MLRAILVFLITLASIVASSVSSGADSNFASRWEEIKSEASPDQLYRLLYDLPKGGDPHVCLPTSQS